MVDTLRSEHLSEGTRPIIAGINITKRLTSETFKQIGRIEKSGEFVNYDGSTYEWENANILNSGDNTYVISDCNEKNKYSTRYCDCTGIAMVGTDKNTGKQISVLSHQDPEKFLRKKRKQFEKNLKQRIEVLLERTKTGTLDAVVFGGRIAEASFHQDDVYINSIALLNKIILEEVGFSPVVLTGPNTQIYDGSTQVYFHTQKRILHILRPEQSTEVNKAFVPGSIFKTLPFLNNGYQDDFLGKFRKFFSFGSGRKIKIGQ